MNPIFILILCFLYLSSLFLWVLMAIDLYRAIQKGGDYWYDARWWKAPLTHLVLRFGVARIYKHKTPAGNNWLEREVTLGKATFWTRLKLIKNAPQS